MADKSPRAPSPELWRRRPFTSQTASSPVQVAVVVQRQSRLSRPQITRDTRVSTLQQLGPAMAQWLAASPSHSAPL
uniref:Polyketide synthase n=1 Tax=Peronospora matthiolae TaxID=2874970 RepID=A0AAV1TWR9_9STRA